MKCPIIIFTENDKRMASIKKLIWNIELLKKRDEWTDNIQAIDLEGNLFFIQKLEQDSGVLFWESIKNLGGIVKVKPIFDKESQLMSLDDLKLRIKNHVNANRAFWAPMNDGRGV